MIFELNKPEATQQALDILRSPDNFHFIGIFMLVSVLFIYFSELGKKNFRGLASALTLYGIHWFVEIINAVIQHTTGHALWTVPTGTMYSILVGVGMELSLMFSIAGLAVSKVLPDDPKEKILGIPNRILFGVVNAALASIIEIFLVTTPTFVWVYPWWNSITVFVIVYLPFFLGATYAYDWKKKTRRIVLSSIWGLDAILLVLFVGLGWI